ncbi:hypothetical protein OG234_19550 [Streptomyces sp. NBC_01420]|uniref:hypothetical protein n=1 Tax=Streptomyces sp. NBC_01420 TaxID=2903858 RepID=UPI003251CA9C
MIPGQSPPRQSATYRAIAGCGGTLAAAVVIGVFWAVASVPRPPPPGTTNEEQVGYAMERGAGAYARALFAASRDAPLTEARLADVPLPREGGIEAPGLSRKGDTTVVTFSTHARYGRPDDLKETTACYQVELVARLVHPNLKKAPDSFCSERAGARHKGLPGSQPNDSASGASAGTRPSAAARVSRPRTAA